MEYIQKAPRLLFTDECIKQYFTNFNFLHGKYTLFILCIIIKYLPLLINKNN